MLLWSGQVAFCKSNCFSFLVPMNASKQVKFLIILGIFLGCGCQYCFYVWYVNKWLKLFSVTSYPWKIECKCHQIYSKMMRRIYNKKALSQIEQSYQKFLSLILIIIKYLIIDQIFVYLVQTYVISLLIAWFLVPCSECLLNSSSTLSCKTWYFNFDFSKC